MYDLPTWPVRVFARGSTTSLLWAWIVLLGVLGFVLNLALLAVERRALRWQPTRAAASGR